MAAYIIARVNVTNWDKYHEYIKVTPSVVEKFDGKFIVRGGDMATLEGPEELHRIVILEFPTLKKAREFYESPEYQEARRLRTDAATAQLIAIDGIE
jgi:uncharacterized protein (DUF1330 family)